MLRPGLYTVLALALSSCSSQSCRVQATAGPPEGPDTSPSGADARQPAGAPPPTLECVHQGSGKDYQVGPGKAYESLGQVPFEGLRGGDTVRVFWRPEPYREKLMISGVGSEAQPIRVCGVAGPKGELPTLDGENATTRRELDFPYDGHQPRGVVIIGHKHGDPWPLTPGHIVFEGFLVRNASPPAKFTDKSGNVQTYAEPAAGIFVQRAENVTIRGCEVTGNANGLFIGTAGDVELTKNVLIEKNWVHDNGSLTTYYNHNVYNEASGVVYQFNRFGSPRPGSAGEVLGANIKERSAGVVIRYNWIEDGAHILDIVDAQEAQATTVPMPSFHATYVYGNVLLRGKKAGGSLVHYGGDSGIFKNYRKGTLFFFGNTVVVKNGTHRDYEGTSIFELSTNEERLEARNNVFFSFAEPSRRRRVVMLGARDDKVAGVASFAGNWVTDGWDAVSEGPRISSSAEVTGLDSSKRGSDPGFASAKADDYALAKGAEARGIGAAPSPPIPPDHAIRFEYVRHQSSRPRTVATPPTAGAFE